MVGRRQRALEAWTERAGAANGAFAGKEVVAKGLTDGAPIEPVELEEGMIAYGALAALADTSLRCGGGARGGVEMAIWPSAWPVNRAR